MFSELPVFTAFLSHVPEDCKPLIKQLSLAHRYDHDIGEKAEKQQLKAMAESLTGLRTLYWQGLDRTASVNERGTEWSKFHTSSSFSILNHVNPPLAARSSQDDFQAFHTPPYNNSADQTPEPHELRKIITVLNHSMHLNKVFYDHRGCGCCTLIRFTDASGEERDHVRINLVTPGNRPRLTYDVLRKFNSTRQKNTRLGKKRIAQISV